MRRLRRSLVALGLAVATLFAVATPANAVWVGGYCSANAAGHRYDLYTYLDYQHTVQGINIYTVEWDILTTGPDFLLNNKNNIIVRIHGQQASGAISTIYSYTSGDNIPKGISEIAINGRAPSQYTKVQLYVEVVFDVPNYPDPRCGANTPWR